jgi:arabinan endo-1,5-alpha-L-arabinosidase
MNTPLDLTQIQVRDPFVLPNVADKTYYLYKANVEIDGVQVHKSTDLKSWSDPITVFVRPIGFWGGAEIWAPEVHLFGGKYYLFVTFDGRSGRGTEILRADGPTGPFAVFSPEANTPPEQQCLDGTPWVDDTGQNWLVYCDEWLRVGDGAMRAVKMSSDWSARRGGNLLLFHASQVPWVKPIKSGCYVTDGPYFKTGRDGTLRMIWSSFCHPDGAYGVGVAESKSGKIEGPWSHRREPIFQQDGGHGMIFKDFQERTLLLLHLPNSRHPERAKFFEIIDPDTLRLRAM